jgi:ribonuclease HI
MEAAAVIELFTDGACSGNPGPGGFASILRYKGKEKIISGGFNCTTNNRMELLAVIEGLRAIKNPAIPIRIYSDSSYVVDAVNKGWLVKWQRIGFKNKKNADLWQTYLQHSKGKQITFIWIRGHAGHPENERCDQLAVAASLMPHLPDDTGYVGESIAG